MSKFDKLKEALKKIGWTTIHSGCNFYRFHNHKGEDSGLEYHHNIKNPESDEIKITFPTRHTGGCYFTMSDCEIKEHPEDNFVCVKVTEKVFINFYNQDMKKKVSE